MNTKRLFLVFSVAVIGAMVGVYCFTLFHKPEKTIVQVPQTAVTSTRLAGYGNGAEGGADFTVAAEKSVEAVVHVMVKQESKMQSYNNPFYEFFYGPNNTPKQQGPRVTGSGSGVILSSDGYIVTNNHVIEDAEEIEVVLNDRTSYTAKLVGTDPTTDIALLKIEPKKELTYLNFGSSESLKVGEWVLAVGNPFNLTSTVTAGIVSAKSRSINILSGRNNPMGIEAFIQTDAAVNPGNSGGALVNTRGELVGINTAIASQTGSYSGYSFAVPSSIAQKVVADLREFGDVQRAFIGVQIIGVTAEIAKEFELDNIKGVYVAEVTDNGAAEEAGIKKGDVILNIDGKEVNTNSQLIEKVSQHRPGDKINLTVNRNGDTKEFTLTLRNSYGSTDLVKESDGMSKLLGANFEEVSDELKEELDLNYGLQVTDIRSGKIRDAGVKEGYIIVKANRSPIESTKDLKDNIAASDGALFLTGVYPNGQTAYYAINLDD